MQILPHIAPPPPPPSTVLTTHSKHTDYISTTLLSLSLCVSYIVLKIFLFDYVMKNYTFNYLHRNAIIVHNSELLVFLLGEKNGFLS